MRIEIKQRIEQIRRGEVPDGYKKTLFGVAPKEWTISRIDKICRLSSGSTPRRDNSDNFKGDILWITSGELKNKVISDTNEKINEGAAKSSHLEMYDQGTVVIAIYGLEAEGVRGTASIIAKKSTISQACMAFTNFKNVYNEYFYYWYIKNGQVIGLRYAQGTKQQNLSSEIIGSFPFCFPIEEEQRKIVAILATQDKMIELYEKKIEQLQLLKKICLQKMFPKEGSLVPEVRFPNFTASWEQSKIGEITSTYSGGTPSVDVKEYYNGDIPFIRSAEINNASTELFISRKGLENSSAKLVQAGTILYALYGATSGEVGRAKLDGAINQAILAIKPHDKFDAEFITYWLRHNKDKIIDTYLQGGQGNLSGEIVKNLHIKFPLQNEQQQIGHFFHNLDNLITLHQRRRDEEKRKKKALMQLLLTGIVRV